MDNIQHVLIPALRGFPAGYGTVREIREGSDESRFFMILEDNAASARTGIGISRALTPILRTKTLKLVGLDGAFGPYDCIWFRAFPDSEVRKEVAEIFVKRLQLRGVELCRIVGDEFYEICGVEDRELYLEALRLWRSGGLDEYVALEEKRAAACVENLLERMAQNQVQIAALTVCGNLPAMVAEEFERRGHSYAIIRPEGFEEGTAVSRTLPREPGRIDKVVCCNLSFAFAQNKPEVLKELKDTPDALNEFGYPIYDLGAAADRLVKAQALVQQGDCEESVPGLTTAARMYSALCLSLRHQASVLMNGSPEEVEWILKPKSKQPNDVGAEAIEGRRAAALQRTQEAANRSAEFAATAEHQLGIVLFRLRRLNEALLHLDQATRMQPDSEAAWANKAAVHIEKEQYGEAISCCDKAIAINPSFRNAWYNKFSALTRVGRFDEADECLRTFRGLPNPQESP